MITNKPESGSGSGLKEYGTVTLVVPSDSFVCCLFYDFSQFLEEKPEDSVP
jgi:hypothetical protein